MGDREGIVASLAFRAVNDYLSIMHIVTMNGSRF